MTAAAVGAALLIAQQVAARAVRDALFLSSFEVRSLPFVMMASALLALAGAQVLSRALGRHSPARVVPAAALLSAALLVAEWALSLAWPRAAAVAVYLHVAAFGGALVSGFWSLVNERFDPYTARRVVGRIGTGASAGGVAGGLVAWAASQVLSVSSTLLLLAALNVGAAIVLQRGRGPIVAAAGAGRDGPGAAVSLLARSAYLRDIALLVALGAFVEAIVDFLFKAEAAGRFAGGGALLSVFALFHAAMSVLGLLMQATLARVGLQRLGIAGTLALRPALTAASAMLGAVAPRFDTATLARGAHESLTNSLFRSSYELLYTPLPEGEKRRVKALVDVAVDKAGALVGSGLVALALLLLPGGASPALFALAALGSLVTLALSRRIHLGYVHTLELSLLAGRVRLDPDDVVDSATQLTLAQTGLIERETLLWQIEGLRGQASDVTGPAHAPPLPVAPPPPAGTAAAPEPLLEALEAIRSGDPRRVRAALSAHPEPGPLLVAATLPLLAKDETFPDVLRALRRAAPRVTGQLLDALLDRDRDPVVRRRVPRVLKACPTPRAVEGLVVALDEPIFEIRAAAAAALAAIHERSSASRVPREHVFERVRRELDSGEPVDRQLPHLFALLSLTVERQPLQIAWAGARSDDRRLRGTALEYLSNVVPEDVFPRLVSLFGASTVRFGGPPRPLEQVADELRASAAGLRLERPPWREGGEG